MAALIAGECIDMLDVAFKLQFKAKLFENDLSTSKSAALLATASTVGLVFTGLPTPELQVVQLRSLEYSDMEKETVPRRTYALPSPAVNIGISCDHSLLAIDVVVGGVPFIYIYKVDSFLTNNVQKVTEIRISPNEHVHCSQILWNPVINNMFALLTESGGLCVYNLQEKGIEFYSIDKSEVAQSACWSPKGKQIVVGFANGKLVQYKQDLKPAKTIPCPPNIVDGQFGVIALQWLSTYQFAAVFLKNEEGSVPALHIINAPKTAPQPTYINYDDICYSQSGPRKAQVFLIYIQQWNMLLMASANSMEVGVLGTTETGETPTWCQWVSTDDSRAELPLTADKQETFPIGFVLETGCTKRLIVNETERPVMPMIHIMSTHGFLLSFTILNSKSNYVDICSPPRPVPTSAQSLFVEAAVTTEIEAPPSIQQPIPQPAATSTPQATKTKTFFAPTEPKSATSLFGMGSASTASIFGVGQAASSTTPALSFGMATSSVGGGDAKPSLFGGGAMDKPISSIFTPTVPAVSVSAPISVFGSLATVKPTMTAPPSQPSQPKEIVASNKPLITVPPTYSQSIQPSQPPEQPVEPTPKATVKTEEDNKIIRLMIGEELQTIEKDLKSLLVRSKNLNVTIGTSEESSQMIRTLDGLQEWGKDALENTDTLSADIQQLRLGINETFQMVAEAKSKFAMYQDANQLQFQEAQSISLTNKRQVSRLRNIQQSNELQVQMIDRQLSAQWSGYEDEMKANSRNRMHIPSLEGMYQTLSKLQEIIQTQVIKLGVIKKRIGMKENLKTLQSTKKDGIDSLTDSLISMSIADQVKTETSKLSASKLTQIRSALMGRKTVQIKPMRPNRPGLNSEVVKEKVLQNATARKAVAAKKETVTKPKKVEEPIKVSQPAAPVKTVAQPPTAFAASSTPAFAAQPPVSFAAPLPQMPAKPIAIAATSAPSFATAFTGFGQKTTAGSSLFQVPKPTVAAVETSKPIMTMANPIFGSAASTPILSFGSSNPAATSISFGGAKPSTESTLSFGSLSKPATGGLSFGLLPKPDESTKTAAAPPPLSFGSGLTVTTVPKTVPKTVPEFTFPTISMGVSTMTSAKPDETVPKPLFGGFESVTAKPVAVTTASQPLLPLPLQVQAQPQANKPEASLVVSMMPPAAKEKQQMIVNPVAVKKSEEESMPTSTTTNVVLGSKNKENTPLLPTPVTAAAPTAAEKQPLLSALLTKPTPEPQNPPTIASPTVVSSADIKKPIATTSSFSFGAAFGAAAVSAPTTTTASSASASFSFASPVDLTTPAASQASGFSFTSALDTTPVSGTMSTAPPADSLFQGFNICSPTSTSATATTTPVGNIFGSALSFGAKSDTSTTSIFGGGGGGASTGGFGAPATVAAPMTGSVFGTTTTQATSPPTGFFNSMSGAAQPTGGTSIFSLPKPDQSVFGAPAQPASPFGAQPAQPQPAGIFGGGGAANNSSPFGASAFSSPTAGGGSIFGGGGAPQQPTSGGSIFGSASAFSSPTSGGSVFGNTAPTAGSSIFGGGAANQAPTFGGAPTFGSPTGAFGGGGQSVFGGSATFGAPPTFGSPTGFGSAALSSPTQGNSLFEQLGASSQGNLFGNLANQNVSAEKPVFGGQQFSSWR